MKKPDARTTKTQTTKAGPLTILTTVDVADATLELTPGRMLKFLRAAGTHPAIRVALAAVGYDDGEHRRGWELLHNASGYQQKDQYGSVVDPNVSGAINTLDAQDEGLHVRVDASLRHRHPAVRALLLDGIRPGQGAAAVLFVRELLKRLSGLETTKGATASEAKAALAVLAARGITPEKRVELAALVKTAESLTAMTPSETPNALDPRDRAHLLAARAWFEEWSEIARAELKRKDYLILLGLAQRKSPKKPAPAVKEDKPAG